MWLSPVMFHYGLCHMSIQEAPRVLPNSLKGWGVCYHVYVIGAHKEHMWTVGTCPTTVLLYTTNECVYEWQHQRWLVLGILHKVWCGPVCSPGSWSGRGWLPLILVWHRTVVGLSCSYCQAHLKRTTNPSCGALYKSLTYYYYYYLHRGICQARTQHRGHCPYMHICQKWVEVPKFLNISTCLT